MVHSFLLIQLQAVILKPFYDQNHALKFTNSKHDIFGISVLNMMIYAAEFYSFL